MADAAERVPAADAAIATAALKFTVGTAMKSFKFVTISCASCRHPLHATMRRALSCHILNAMLALCILMSIVNVCRRLSYVLAAAPRGFHVALVKCFNTLRRNCKRLFLAAYFIGFTMLLNIRTYTYFSHCYFSNHCIHSYDGISRGS